MPAHDRILAFVTAVKSRLDLAWLVRVLCGSLLAIGVALCIWCVWWVAQGYAVPRIGYIAAAVLLPLLALALWLAGRVSARKAARVADEHFDLKDAISSHLGFSEAKREGEFIALQAEATAVRVQALSPHSLPITWPRRVLTIAGVLLMACFVMGFKKASPIVLERIALEEETTRKTDEINEELEKQIEDLLKTASEDEKELLRPDEWRQWVKELRETKDQKAAMRQYAELERKLTEAAQKLSQRDTEQLLSKAAQEMQQVAELKPIAKSLEEQNYRNAAEQLRQMKLQADVRKPDEAQKELAKLKSASQRMAAAARNFQQRTGKQGNQNQGNQSQSSQNQNSQQNGNNQQQAQGQQGSQGQQSMDQQMAALEQAVQNLEQQLQQQNQSQQNQSQCQQCQNQANQQLQSLCQSMCQSAGQRDMMKKLQKLSQCAGQCQGYLGNKECQSLGQCLGQKPGGKKAGWGSSEDRRAESDPTRDNGNRDQLTGQKGAGPSNTSIESADSGSGKATRTATLQEKVFQRQVESFIQREDVPAEVKEGVKEYFKGIQQVGEEKKNVE
ncbi:MAG: hypothetical protein IAE77_09470 [Prosthecobacter sp.]|jgi:hypothetical protein|uniref:hypothetical protein n=1 Tax=Prosthecobacter sp. TaxID=1965333 RepID=UPI0019D9E657|nr:hypothetical protein [Prosthecobacter sp.]MBE2283670.1 hypothetical protein [Prosthecobacter sp.]